MNRDQALQVIRKLAENLIGQCQLFCSCGEVISVAENDVDKMADHLSHLVKIEGLMLKGDEPKDNFIPYIYPTDQFKPWPYDFGSSGTAGGSSGIMPGGGGGGNGYSPFMTTAGDESVNQPGHQTGFKEVIDKLDEDDNKP